MPLISRFHDGNRPDALDFSLERKAVPVPIPIYTHRAITSIQRCRLSWLRSRPPQSKPKLSTRPCIKSFPGLDRVSLLSLEGRLIMPVRICNYYANRMNRPRGQVDLIFRNNAFYLAVVVDAPKSSPIDATAVLGIDLGVKNIAVDSTWESFSCDNIKRVRTKIDIIKSDLQRCDTPSAKRHLKKIGKRESRFRRDTSLAGS